MPKPELVTADTRRVVRISALFAPAWEREDARQEAWLAICEAAPRYREGDGHKFTTFCRPRVKGALKDFGRRNDPLSRDQRRKGEATPVHVDIAEALNVCEPPRQVKTVLERELRDAIPRLNPQRRRAIQGLYFEERTLADVGRELGVTEGRACQIVKRALADLRKLLDADNARLMARAA
jgi:RNA polymerase sigma factor (sigma-70 family)